MCGSTAAQGAALQSQTNFASQLQNEAGQVFGNSSSVYNDLVNSLSPTVAAGPSQEGFSAAEKSNLDSRAITDTGNAYKNAKAAVGDADSAIGGGNNSDVPSGATTATNLSTANAAAQQTASELGEINQADYTTGLQNYDTAVSGLTNAPSVFGAADSANNIVSNSQENEANTANQIATQANSPMQAAVGAAGEILGSAAKGATAGGG